MDVWVSTACCVQSNETWLTKTDFTGRIHRRKPYGKTMPDRSRKASAKKEGEVKANARTDTETKSPAVTAVLRFEN